MKLFSREKSYGETRKEFVESFEAEYVAWLLACHGGNISAAARAAKVDRKHLSDLRQKHGVGRGMKGERK